MIVHEPTKCLWCGEPVKVYSDPEWGLWVDDEIGLSVHLEPWMIYRDINSRLFLCIKHPYFPYTHDVWEEASHG